LILLNVDKDIISTLNHINNWLIYCNLIDLYLLIMYCYNTLQSYRIEFMHGNSLLIHSLFNYEWET